MADYSEEKLELIKQYIDSESDDVYFENFDGRYDIIMVVDWGEFDEDIINYCEKILETKSLSVETVDANNKQGFEIYIYFNDSKTLIPYQGAGADRDTTVITLNEVIQPNYEIRLCEISTGSDTLEFIPLPTEIWNQLENNYGEKVNRLFRKIEKNSTLFE